MIDYLSLISKHTAGEDPRTVPAFIIHSALVTKKALDIANGHLERVPDARLDLRLLEEIGMLHDIGIFRTETPRLFTHGAVPYLGHLDQGRRILEGEGLPIHARGAKNHAAIPKEGVVSRSMPLPEEDHVPETPEQEILHIADQFYSKVFRELFRERTLEEVRDNVRSYGHGRLEYFDRLWEKYCGEGNTL